VWSYSGGWNLTGGLSGADASQHAAGRQIFSVALADLGLSVGDVILFDVVSTGGGNDPGVDHLSNSAFATDDWGVTSTAGQFLAYTIAPIPTPGALALLGLGGLVTSRRRR
jgi:MYXO-CTERM domain-containing protein